MRFLPALVSALLLLPLAARGDDAPKPRSLHAAPINGMELGMTITEALPVLVQNGFRTPRINGNSRTYTTTVKAANGAQQTVGYITEQGFINDKMEDHTPRPGGVEIYLSWLGIDPNGPAYQRRFDGDGKIWSIRRSEMLQTPSSYDLVMDALRQKFNFAEVDCSKDFKQTRSLQQGVHGPAAGGGTQVYLPAGVGCNARMTNKDVLLNVEREVDTGVLPSASLQLYFRFDGNGLVTSTEFQLYSAGLATDEVVRFFEIARNDMTNRTEEGSGLSDF